MAIASEITKDNFKSGRRTYKLFKGTRKEWKDLALKHWNETGDVNNESFYKKYGRMLHEDGSGKVLAIKSVTKKGSPRAYRVASTADLAADSERRKKDQFGTNEDIDKQIKELNSKKAWPPGKSKEGFLKWQKSVYAEAQSEARAYAQKTGAKSDAGHARASKLGGPSARSNLAPEFSAINKAKQEKGIERTDIELDEAGISRSKTHAFQEYLMEGTSPKVRNVSDYSRLVRSILAHETGISTDQAMAIGENELIQKGPQQRELTQVRQKNLKLKDTTSTIGDLKISRVNPKDTNALDLAIQQPVTRAPKIPEPKNGINLKHVRRALAIGGQSPWTPVNIASDVLGGVLDVGQAVVNPTPTNRAHAVLGGSQALLSGLSPVVAAAPVLGARPLAVGMYGLSNKLGQAQMQLGLGQAGLEGAKIVKQNKLNIKPNLKIGK